MWSRVYGCGMDVLDNPQLLAAVRKGIKSTRARGEKLHPDIVIKAACTECFGSDYTSDQLHQARSLFFALGPTGERKGRG